MGGEEDVNPYPDLGENQMPRIGEQEEDGIAERAAQQADVMRLGLADAPCQQRQEGERGDRSDSELLLAYSGSEVRPAPLV